MKKYSYIIIACLSCILTSCNTLKEQQIVGNWVYKLVENVDDMQITTNGTCVFDDNGSVCDRAKFTIKSVDESEDIPMLIEISGSLMTKSDWSVNENSLVLSPVVADINFKSYKYYINETHEYLGELSSREINELVSGLKTEMKTEMMKASTEKILMLQENKFVTEIDEDGKKTTCTYKRVN